MKDIIAKVKENKEIAQNVYSLTVTLSEDVGEIRGGQFLNISTGDSSRLLRRPLGVVKAEGKDVTVCYQIKGEGTRALSKMGAGETVYVLLPLGNGFNLENAENIAVIGGGVGVFPLLATLKQYCKEKKFYTFFGFRNKNAVCFESEAKSYSEKFTLVTDDGSAGVKGNAVSAYFSSGVKPDLIISCGPPVMLKALKNALSERGDKTPCLVSLEERMGCGIGACLVCVCKKTDNGNVRVCKDGPVFNINDVEI